MQVALGGTFEEPGYFGSSTASGKSSPVTISTNIPGVLSRLTVVQNMRTLRKLATTLTCSP